MTVIITSGMFFLGRRTSSRIFYRTFLFVVYGLFPVDIPAAGFYDLAARVSGTHHACTPQWGLVDALLVQLICLCGRSCVRQVMHCVVLLCAHECLSMCLGLCLHVSLPFLLLCLFACPWCVVVVDAVIVVLCLCVFVCVVVCLFVLLVCLYCIVCLIGYKCVLVCLFDWLLVLLLLCVYVYVYVWCVIHYALPSAE